MDAFLGPAPELIDALATSLAEVRELLVRHGEEHASARLRAIENALSVRDTSAIHSVISETTGGMGSFNDLTLRSSDGHDMDGLPESVINERLRRGVEELRARALAARAAPWFRQPRAS
jgi:hypothetical protein